MRIISGRYGGRRIEVPKNMVLRPTTDRAKESLLNILKNRLELCQSTALDLFSGTGSISYELASQGAKKVVSVEQNPYCYRFIKRTAAELDLPIYPLKRDVFRFLERMTQRFDLIFADPPYWLAEGDYIGLHNRVFDGEILKPGGLLVLEHGGRRRFEELEGFVETRNYGGVHLSFFARREGSR